MLKETNQETNLIPIVKLRRSLSNPLEYASEAKKLVYEKEPKQDKNVFKIKNSKRMFEGANEENNGSDEYLETSGMQNMHENVKAIKIDGGDEMISFTVDADEFNRNKMVEVSFISNNDILDNLKNN